MHPKDQEAEEHSDSHQGDGRGRREELPVVDAEVPHHGQDHHEHGHHQAAGADGHAGGPESPGDPRADSCPGLSPVLWGGGLVQRLRDVAVDHAVVCDVQGEQSLLGVLQQLALVDQFYLMLPTWEVFTGEEEEEEEEEGGEMLKDFRPHCISWCAVQYAEANVSIASRLSSSECRVSVWRFMSLTWLILRS